MRAGVFGFFALLIVPAICSAQHDAAMAAARAVAGSPVQAAPKAAPAAPAAAAATTPPTPAAGTTTPASTTAPGPAAATPVTGTTALAPQLEPQGFSYNPEGRRDPFVSLLRRGSGSETKSSGSKTAGLRGLGAGEVTLKGTMASKGGYVAILQGADAKNYVVHAGEQLADGTIRTISADALVILQQVNDPLSTETHREVRKVLRQTEEAR